MIKISIIMPVYNCEMYLKESINSVFKQTLEEWELICIDDGSNDDSLYILNEYEKKDSRIKVYTQQNRGAGIARNLGLKNAMGEYVAFLDADDFFYDNDALEDMYSICKLYGINACGSKIKLLRNNVIGDDLTLISIVKESNNKNILNYEDYQFDYGFTGFIYKTCVLKNNSVEFPIYRRFEDPPFLVKAMHSIKEFSFSKKSLYCYRTPNVIERFNYINTVDLLKGLLENLNFSINNRLELLFDKTLERLEVEYLSIISNNILENSVEILELLLKINEVVNVKKEGYVVLPLKNILKSLVEIKKYNQKRILKSMLDSNQIYIYGSGNATTDFLSTLKRLNIYEKVKSIIVTSLEGNPCKINEIPVIELIEYKYSKGDLILITVTSIYQKQIIDNLKRNGINNFEIIDASIVSL